MPLHGAASQPPPPYGMTPLPHPPPPGYVAPRDVPGTAVRQFGNVANAVLFSAGAVVATTVVGIAVALWARTQLVLPTTKAEVLPIVRADDVRWFSFMAITVAHLFLAASWATYLHQAHAWVARTTPIKGKRMAAWSPFIPIANFWLPWRALKRLYDATNAKEQTVQTALGWWVLYAGTAFTGLMIVGSYGNSYDEANFSAARTALIVEAANGAAAIGVAVLGCVVLRRLHHAIVGDGPPVP